MKAYKLELKVNEVSQKKETEKIYRAEINLADSTTFSEIVKFLDDVKRVYKKGMTAIKTGSQMELEITESVYENWLEPGKELIQKSFNRWVSIPTHEQDDQGIYLRPDTRYTEEHRDMYLSKDVLKDLAFTLR